MLVLHCFSRAKTNKNFAHLL